MTGQIKIRQAKGTWVVRASGAVIGESANALELTEGEMPPVIYFPRADIGMAFLEASDKSSHSPNIGDAQYYAVTVPGEVLKNAAWSYEAPNEAAAQIAGHLAFHTDRVAIEKL